jgi:hypothetical protein
MSHSQIGHREGVDSRLLVVGSQTASLTPGPSFAHNLGCRCPNCQCEGIFDIYVSRPFQWHQEHPNARCFAPCCRALNIRESRRTPNPNSFQVLGFTPTFGQVRVVTIRVSVEEDSNAKNDGLVAFRVNIPNRWGDKYFWKAPSNYRTMEWLINRINTSPTAITRRPSSLEPQTLR